MTDVVQKLWGFCHTLRHDGVDYSDYIADIPDLDSCSAFGKTPEEALAEVERAKAAWIEAARAEGKPVPPPRYRPVIYQAAG
jgi:predicted RNase H-like HicB family nuclease